MPELPKILTRRAITDSPLFRVEAVDLEFSNGARREYHYLRSGGLGAVIIVAINEQREVLLIQEYGIGVEAYEWALPKGRVDEGESVEEAADRELKEECGFGARRTTLLKSLAQSPNYMQHKTHIVLAQDLYPCRLPGDEPEPLTLQTWPLADIEQIFDWSDFNEARSIAALLIARRWIEMHQ